MRRPLSLLVAGVLAAGLLPSSNAAAAGPLTRQTFSCPDLGEVVVGFTGAATARGAARVVDEGPVSIQSVRFTDAAGRSTDSVPASANALACTPLAVSGTSNQFVAGRGTAATKGTLTLRVLVDTDAAITAAAQQTTQGSYSASAVANDPAGYGQVVPFPYRSQLASWANSRSGSVAVAQRPSGSSTIYSYVKGSASNVTASIVKVQVMAAVMYRAQAAKRSLSSWEKSQMVPMIRYSDNNATSALWNSLGGGSYVKAVNARMGLRNTVPGPGRYWGLTVTSAPDNVVLVDHFSRKNPVISDANRAYGLSLMRTVSSDQDWGVTAGPGDDVAVKNGWLPRTDGWHVNSIGYNHKLPRPYTAAVLTHSSSAGMSTQIGTIEGVSRIMWRNTKTARGDRTGDGRSDLVVLDTTNTRWSKVSSNGVLGAPVKANGGWTATWIGSPGDVNGDGRADLLARNRAGQLLLYPGTARGFTTARVLGSGWNQFHALTVVDLDGDRRMDVLGANAAGELVRYILSASAAPVRVGVVSRGWKTTRPLGIGDVDNDGRDDLLAVRTDKTLWAYRSTGSGFALVGKRGTGFGFKTFATPGDVTGDLVPDLVAWDGSKVHLYPMTRGFWFQTRRSSAGVTGLRLMA